MPSWTRRLAWSDDAERERANSVMKRCIHDTDLSVSGHVNPRGPRLYPNLLCLDEVQL
jgi:hypothetical protein